MAPRPANLNLNNRDNGDLPLPPKQNMYMDLPSPRTGEVPPALSPLDAFAMHSRALARKFEEEARNGRRISRLPHNDVARELGNRPDYFRAVSGGSETAMSDVPEVQEEMSPTTTNGLTISGGDEKDRPVSFYPMLGNVSQQRSNPPFSTPMESFDEEEEQTQDYFGIAAPRAASPEPVDITTLNIAPPTPDTPSLTNSLDSLHSTQTRTMTNGSARSQHSLRSLAPPRSPAVAKSQRSMQSIRSVPPDSGDEDGSQAGSTAMSSSRKFSASSNASIPLSPFSPHMHPMNRSPSMTSEYSMNGSQVASNRRMNFSRPLSSGGSRPPMESRPSFDSRSSFETCPSIETPHRQASGSTHPSSCLSRQASQDDATPSASPHVDDARDRQTSNNASSYIYAKYDLPRGRNVERGSLGKRESWIHNQFTWDDKTPIELPPSQRERTNSDSAAFEKYGRAQDTIGTTNTDQGRLGRDAAGSGVSRSRSADHRQDKSPSFHKSSPSIKTQGTDSTERTIKATPLHQRSPSHELSAEEHLEIGIQAHSAGHLNKSTYHLRLAAKAGLPTAMLLYALACRHGWGMRPNQEEGVMWLRKAIDGSGLDIADVEATLASASRALNVDSSSSAAENKKRKAQFALAVYELGISYMNGWGCAKDKPLAVKCYEVAGSWGDCDALAEAGFCYTQGVGCKKDLKKAASLYRKAADGGMSMAGNSWIYKQKYMDDPAPPPPPPKTFEKERGRIDTQAYLLMEAQQREKEAKHPTRARARSLWSRKKK